MIINVTVVECVREPSVPERVNRNVPVLTEAVVVIVSVDVVCPLAGSVTGLGLNEGVAPVGNPVQLNVTAEL